MKTLFTLATTAALMAAAPAATAQFTVDGMASAAEIGTGLGKYQLVGSYTNTHSEADRGLREMYVGYTATTLNIMVVGSAESASGAYRALVVYLNTPGRSGAPAGVQLIGGNDGPSPLKHKPTLDLQADYGFRVSVGPTSAAATDVYFSRVSYVTGGTVTPGNDTYIGPGSKAGAAVTAPTSLDLAGSKFAYLNSATLTANTNRTGFEIEIPLAALGTATTPVAAGSRIDLFAAYTDADGVFTTDVIPQVAERATPFGADPNFAAIPGTQAVAYVLGSGVLAGRDAVATELNFAAYPNPATESATISYRVPAGQQPVSLAVYNTLGQLVRSLAQGKQAGRQEYTLRNLPAGAYLVRLSVGQQTTACKVVVE